MLSNIIRTVLIYVCRGGRGVLNACCGAPCRNCPISRFSTGATISIFYNEELRIRQQLLGRDGQWLITVSHSIGTVGAVHLWEAADPKDQNLCQNCPTLPYKTHYYKPCRYHRTSQFFNVSAWNIENGRVWGRGKRKFWINWYISNKWWLMRINLKMTTKPCIWVKKADCLVEC